MVSSFSWLVEKIKIIMEQGIRLIVVKVEIVEISNNKFRENIMNMTTIGFVAKLTASNPDVELLHPICCD